MTHRRHQDEVGHDIGNVRHVTRDTCKDMDIMKGDMQDMDFEKADTEVGII